MTAEERRQRAKERRELLLAADSADEPRFWPRFGDALRRTPPAGVLLIGIIGSLIGLVSLAVSFILYFSQASQRADDLNRRFSADHAISCTFYGDLGTIVIANPNSAAGIKALQRVFSDAGDVHRAYRCGPLPDSTVITPGPAATPVPTPR